jgi:hypothetical protein
MPKRIGSSRRTSGAVAIAQSHPGEDGGEGVAGEDRLARPQTEPLRVPCRLRATSG